MKLVFKRGACSMAAATALVLAGCGGGSTSTTPNDPNPPANPPTLTCSAAGLAAAAKSTQPTVCMLTSKGELVLELRPDVAPLSSANFLKYVNDGYYNNSLVHRVDKTTPLFQAGRFSTQFVPKVPTYPAINSEAANGLKNVRGSLGMARTTDINSAQAEFYVNAVDNTAFDRVTTTTPITEGYTVFGKVISGMDTLDAIVAVPVNGMEPKSPLVIYWAQQLNKRT